MKMDPKDFQDFIKKITPKVDMNEILEMYKKNLDYKSMKNYKNSSNFVDAVKVARNYEKDQETHSSSFQ